MRFVIDLDSLEVIKSATDRSAVVSVEGKRGDDTPFEVSFVRSGVAEELAGSSVLTFGAKQAGKYDGTAVVLNSDFALSGSGTTAKYLASPSFNTEELNALFLIDADDSNDPAYVDLMAEFTWQIGAGAPSSTKTFAFRVYNDVVRDAELSPVAVPPPIGNTAPVNAVAVSMSVTGTLTSNGITPATFSLPIPENGVISGKTAYYDAGDGNSIEWDGAKWVIVHSGSLVEWHSSEGVATPDLVVTWTPQGSATGTPVVTLNAAIPATASPPYLRVAGGFLYIQEAGVWKKTALSAL